MERGIEMYQPNIRRTLEFNMFSSAKSCPSLLLIIAIALITITVNAGNSDILAATKIVEYPSTDVPVDIPDQGTVTSRLTIDDTEEIVDLNVMLNISHRWDGDLTATLRAPDGTRVELFSRVGGKGDDFNNTIFDNEATQLITAGSAPFEGSYIPEGDLSKFYGKSMAGTWKLQVADSSYSTTGTLNSWSLIIQTEKEEELPLSAPVIQPESSVNGGICDIVSWEDVNNTTAYSSQSPVNIPSNGTKTTNLVIDDFGLINDLNVKVNIDHGCNSELDVYLTAPDSTQVELFTDVGGSSENFHDTILDNEASQYITEGTAPFTGSFIPEGNLDDLTGRDIHGTWQLEIIDDGWVASGTLNSWSLIADLANILHYVEAAIDPNFNSIVAKSGWILDNNYTFTNLDPNQVYWYRVKARSQEKWHQTSQMEFNMDTLTDTITTEDGDVVLPVSGSAQEELVYVIENPSFEDSGGWTIEGNDALLVFHTGGYPDYIWGTEGDYVLGTVLNDDYTYDEGAYVYTWQTLDWTAITRVIFDLCNVYGNNLSGMVYIGDELLWTSPPCYGTLKESRNVEIDVSGINGIQDLQLLVEVTRTGRYTAGIFWDNLRTYGIPNDEGLLGQIISTPISINEDDTWDIVTFNTTTPAETTITVDVLGETGSTPISGYANILSGTDLKGLTQKTIRLRANLSSDNSTVTPMLHDWSICYTNAARESTWSNVVSSDCN